MSTCKFLMPVSASIMLSKESCMHPGLGCSHSGETKAVLHKTAHGCHVPSVKLATRTSQMTN
jgi:hypothetical protein